MNKEQYIHGIKFLSVKQIVFLQRLYYNKNHSATAKKMAALLFYKSYTGANSVIGNIGKKFVKEVPNIKVKTYLHTKKERQRFYELVGEYTENGWEMHGDLCNALESLKIVSKNENVSVDILPTEIMDFEGVELKEGKIITVKVDRYERNPIARQKCIQYYGVLCQVCGFDFQKVYGQDAEGFINVHHVKPLAELGKEYIIDPINDLIPVCSNCHSAIHLVKPIKTIKEMKKLFK